ncbi:MAG TPA: MHYT domain-containing protein [Gemmatimonadales bacterium]|jgi:hypothetical protein
MSQLHGYYSTGLVALSVIIAVLASGAALDLTNRVTAARGRARERVMFWREVGTRRVHVNVLRSWVSLERFWLRVITLP